VTITVTPVSEILGADIAGLDMTAPLAPKDVAAIKQAFVDHLVLRFRGQALDARQLAAFSAQFGEL
jgi:taurine dioxygenase